VRLDRVIGEDLAHRPLGEFGHTGVAGGGPPITGMRGQQPRRPQLVRIPQRLRLLAGQRHQPGSRLRGNRRIAAGALAVVQCFDHTQFGRSVKTSANRLGRDPDRAGHRVGRGLCQISQNDPRPLDAARRLSARSRNLLQLLPLRRITDQRNHSTWCRHGSPDSNPQPPSTRSRAKRQNRAQHIDILESMH
jgi:hypothetical protein